VRAATQAQKIRYNSSELFSFVEVAGGNSFLLELFPEKSSCQMLCQLSYGGFYWKDAPKERPSSWWDALVRIGLI
jgi:hypothetical protein